MMKQLKVEKNTKKDEKKEEKNIHRTVVEDSQSFFSREEDEYRQTEARIWLANFSAKSLGL